MQIAEAVTKYHPDKICDIISDSIVDACIERDKKSRVAIECIGGHGTIALMGEITTTSDINFSDIARDTYKELTSREVGVFSNIVKQSPNIKDKVDIGGAGDQGLMIGYACNENELYIPNEMYYARKLLEGYERDGKSQVVWDNGAENVVLSVQGMEQKELEERVKNTLNTKEMYCNNIGRFDIGGFDGDTGCTGRKIVCDSYGGRVPVGGGAFSGKDPSKVDRSGAYMARWIALQLIKEYNAKEVIVKLGYVIGKDKPLLSEALIDGKLTNFNYDCRPKSIIERFNLLRPIYKDTAMNGHFGRHNLAWDIDSLFPA